MIKRKVFLKTILKESKYTRVIISLIFNKFMKLIYYISKCKITFINQSSLSKILLDIISKSIFKNFKI